MNIEDYESYSEVLKNNDESLDKKLIENEYSSQLGSFAYMPKKFLGIDTSLFGSTNPKLYKVHPFLQLKEKSLDKSINYHDRMQAVRYMCRIPYIENIRHCIDSICDILSESNIDPYEKFYFFANNDKYMKLDDLIVYEVHKFFFYLSISEKYPLELTLLSSRYIISNYHYEDDVRYDVLEFILDIADDKDETVYARSECADILANCGEGDEVFFGHKIIKELGELFDNNKNKTIYTNSQNVHTETIDNSVRNIIRSLRKEFNHQLIESKYTIENIHNDLDKIIESKYSNTNDSDYRTQDPEYIKGHVKSFLFRVMTDPSKYERLNLNDILMLVYNKIQTFDEETKQSCLNRMLEECQESLNTCTTGYLTRIINVLTGFVEGEEFVMRINPEEELKASVFARIEAKIRGLPDMLRNDILESLTTEDKTMFDEFLEIHSPEEELRKEYLGILKDEKFTEVWNNTIKIYKGEI
jgi:hypothetical protein